MAGERGTNDTRRWLLLLFLALSVVGLGLASELTRIHVQVHTDPAYRSFCAISRGVNCDTVAESTYAVFLGLPVAVWGALGYLLMAGLAAWGLRESRPGPTWPAGLLLVPAGIAVVASLPLAVVSKAVLGSLCLLCVGSWLINVALFACAWALARQQGGAAATLRADLGALGSRPKQTAALVVVGVAGLALLWSGYPNYWKAAGELRGPGALATGAEAGLPWIGAKQPKLTIVEYSDYECGFCLRAHRELRQLVAEHPDAVRIVHRHFPLDMKCNPTITRPFHQGACDRAAAAMCAEEQGRFWEMNDALFRGQHQKSLDVNAVAERLGLDTARFRSCLESPQTQARLRSDIDSGTGQGVEATPTFVIEGEKFSGQIPKAVLERKLGVPVQTAEPSTGHPRR